MVDIADVNNDRIGREALPARKLFHVWYVSYIYVLSTRLHGCAHRHWRASGVLFSPLSLYVCVYVCVDKITQQHNNWFNQTGWDYNLGGPICRWLTLGRSLRGQRQAPQKCGQNKTIFQDISTNESESIWSFVAEDTLKILSESVMTQHVTGTASNNIRDTIYSLFRLTNHFFRHMVSMMSWCKGIITI